MKKENKFTSIQYLNEKTVINRLMPDEIDA